MERVFGAPMGVFFPLGARLFSQPSWVAAGKPLGGGGKLFKTAPGAFGGARGVFWGKEISGSSLVSPGKGGPLVETFWGGPPLWLGWPPGVLPPRGIDFWGTGALGGT